ncbi:MAG TPA: GxxExxY protein [Pyrinomonadaceae bacterium]|jgi:GxxExxY protein
MSEGTNLIEELFEEDEAREKINQITEKIIGSAYKVSNSLGCGFLERVYENALAHEIKKFGLKVEHQRKIKVFYENVEVGVYEPDLLVEDLVIVELKTVRTIEDVHKAQCLNYLKATGMKICLLINFGNPRIEVKRIVM